MIRLARPTFAEVPLADLSFRRIGSVWLSSVRTDNLHQFGVLADESIRSVVVGTPKFRVSNRTAAVDLGMGQFRVRIV